MIDIVGAFSMEVAVLVSDVRKMVINPRPDVAWINAAQYEAYQLGRQPHNSRVFGAGLTSHSASGRSSITTTVYPWRGFEEYKEMESRREGSGDVGHRS